MNNIPDQDGAYRSPLWLWKNEGKNPFEGGISTSKESLEKILRAGWRISCWPYNSYREGLVPEYVKLERDDYGFLKVKLNPPVLIIWKNNNIYIRMDKPSDQHEHKSRKLLILLLIISLSLNTIAWFSSLFFLTSYLTGHLIFIK